VGLDKPCRSCGKPIHYSYIGPIKGLCGTCADRRTRRVRKSYRRGMVVSPLQRRERRIGRLQTGIVIAGICVAGAAVVAVVLHFVLQ
jgi:hypothetical protein